MRIAVTGGIAEGKSVILGIAASLGVKTVSADEVAKEVRQEPEIQDLIAGRLNSFEPVSADQIRERASEDAGFRRWLNGLMHSRTLSALLNSDAVLFEVPLLLEACVQDHFDQIWVATCGEEEQLRRLSERTGDVGAARRLIAMQLPSAVKLSFADRICRTNTAMLHVQSDVLAALVAESLV